MPPPPNLRASRPLAPWSQYAQPIQGVGVRVGRRAGGLLLLLVAQPAGQVKGCDQRRSLERRAARQDALKLGKLTLLQGRGWRGDRHR